jgi:hypothetical protein
LYVVNYNTLVSSDLCELRKIVEPNVALSALKGCN